MNSPEILSERQVQEIYGFTVPYLRRCRRERRGPRFLKVGKLVRYRRSDIESFLAAHAVETNEKAERMIEKAQIPERERQR